MSPQAIETRQVNDAQVADDLAILNRSLQGEYFGIAAYEAAIGSGLLEDGVVQVAKQFQSDHEQHAGSLIEAIRESGGTPGARKTWEEMAAEFPPPSLSSQEDVLRYAAFRIPFGIFVAPSFRTNFKSRMRKAGIKAGTTEAC